MNSGGHIPLLAKEGWPRHQKNGPVPNRRGRGGRSRVTFRNAVLKHLRVSDHPVCGASVASRLFIDAAATPPHEEGNAPRLNNCRIRSQVHTPPLQTICWYRFFCYTPLVKKCPNVSERLFPSLHHCKEGNI